MPVLAIGLIGGFLAEGVGLSFGLGMAVFGSLAQLLLAKPAKPPTFKSMTSAWGDTWPIVYNQFRVAGKIIQCGPVHKHNEKGKKGGPTYSQTFALGVCEGPRSIGRIWADQQVIYDPRPIVDPSVWTADTVYGVGDVVLPATGSRWQLTATVNGTSGGSTPTFVLSADSPTYDNGIVWIASKYVRRTKIGQQFNFTMRIYTGSEDQLPDAALEEIVGTGMQPGYRGLVYIVFEDHNISKYGNRIPNLDVEILSDTSVPEIWIPMLTSGPDVGTDFEGGDMHEYGVCVDWENRYLYHFSAYGNYYDSGTNTNFDRIFRCRLSDGICDGIFDVRDITFPGTGNSMVSPRTPWYQDGYLYFFTADGSGNSSWGGARASHRLSKIHVSTMLESASYNTYASVHGWPHGVGDDDNYLAAGFTHNGINYALLCQVGVGTPCATEIVHLDLMTLTAADTVGNIRNPHVVNESTGLCWIKNGTTTASFGLMMDNDLADVGTNDFVWGIIDWNYAFTFTSTWFSHPLTDIDPTNNHVTGTSASICSDGASVIVAVTVNENLVGGGSAPIDYTGYHVKMDLTGAIQWAVKYGRGVITGQPAGVYYYSNVVAKSDYSAGTFITIIPPVPDTAVAGTDQYMKIDTATGAVTILSSTHIPNFGDQWISNSLTGEVVFWSRGWFDFVDPLWEEGWVILKPGALGAKYTLGDICRDMSTRVGLRDAQVDMDGLDSVIPRGCAMLSRDTARSFLEAMQPAFFYDLTDIGAEVVGTLRSNGTILEVIPESDLAASTSVSTVVDRIASQRGDDLEIPKDMAVSYYDFDHDYQMGSQPAKRNQVTQYSSGRNTITLPVVMNAGEAANAAERGLYLLWIERNTRKFSVPLSYVRRTPADVVALVKDGKQYAIRITKMNLQPTLVIEGEGVSEDLGAYSLQVPMAVASIATGSFTPGTITPVVTPVLVLIDTAMLRPQDLSPGIYLAGCASEPGGGWDNETAQEAQDGPTGTFTNQATLSVQATIGTMVDQLGDFSRWTVFDDVHTVRVTLLNGSLGSDSRDNLINNFTNLVWTSNGEIWQFQTATFIESTDDGDTYALSGLLRGRFGTEQFVSNHAIGETFVLLVQNGMQVVEYAPSEIGATRYWKGVNDAATAPETAVQTVTMTTRRLMPFAPYFLRGSRDLSGNLTITGLRRMRWRGAPLWSPQETDPPVTMQIDILSGSVVVRTLTSTISGGGSGITDAAAFTAAYSAADQTTDFGSPQALVTIAAYEINAVIGRGYPGSKTL